MSLIQQALDKTKCTNGTRTPNPSPVSKTYAHDPMGAILERELIQVQKKYAYRRSLYWKIALGVLAVGFITVLVFVAVHSKNFWRAESRSVPQPSVRMFGGYMYRLTGITNIRNKPIAVINNRLVGIGDKLNGRAVVTAIKDGEVCLSIQDNELILGL